jgi:SAM-dependent methyltransferase
MTSSRAGQAGLPAPPRLSGLAERLAGALGRPEPFAPHDAPFWDDPYIGSQMLVAHLDPATDAASRRPETIRATVAHLVGALGLGPGSRLLDLGCGPGLYATEFARHGIGVTGLDLSANSIAYAVQQSKRDGHDIDYRAGDYTRVDLGGPYDAAVLIYLDFGVLPDDGRERLLAAVAAALRPGGVFAFDVYTPAWRRVADGHVSVDVSGGGFWRPHPHLVIETTYRFDGRLDLDQHTIVDDDGITTYRVWDRAYSTRAIRRVLAPHGMRLASRWADLTGTPWQPRSPTIAVAAVVE